MDDIEIKLSEEEIKALKNLYFDCRKIVSETNFTEEKNRFRSYTYTLEDLLIKIKNQRKQEN